MAMNKREREAQASARREAELGHALRWSQPLGVELRPDIPEPEFAQRTCGWRFNAHRAMDNLGQIRDSVWEAESGHRSHNPVGGGETKGGIALYSTRLRALQALRQKLEWYFAARLAAVDAEIALECAGKTGDG